MSSEPILSIKNIEVLYSRVISALHGVSIDVHKGEIVSLLGANGSGKTTTCKAVSRLLEAERGEVSKGSIEYKGKDISNLTAFDMVKAGVVQVLEGRHIVAHHRSISHRGSYDGYEFARSDRTRTLNLF